MKINRKEWGTRVTKCLAKTQWRFCVAICCAASVARGALLLQDSFNYTNGNLAGQGPWIGYGTGTPIQVQSGNLSYPGFGLSSGSELAMNALGTNGAYSTFSSVSSGSVYCSFLLAVTGPLNNLSDGTKDFFATLGNSSGYGCALAIGLMPEGPITVTNFWMAYGSVEDVPVTSTTLSLTNTHLVVMSYNFAPGTDSNSCSFWLDPSSSTFGNATAPKPTSTVSANGGPPDPVNSVNEFTWMNANANLVVGDLSIGTTWADVTPELAEAPEPASWNFAAMGLLVLFIIRGWRNRMARR